VSKPFHLILGNAGFRKCYKWHPSGGSLVMNIFAVQVLASC
jgi:hypothetical protein